MNNIQQAIDYKKNIANRFALVEGADITKRVGGENFCVTRKIDGHLQIAFFDNGTTVLLNSNGKEKAQGLNCIEVFSDSLKRAGINQAIIAVELYMPCADGRPRHSDVSRGLSDAEKKNELRLAPFDIVEIDGIRWQAKHYSETHKRLCEIFNNAVVQPVEMVAASTAAEVKEIYKKWVEGDGAEGLVVHSDSRVVWKIKPRHSLDAAVIGYTTTDRGIRSLMFAMCREDGLFQMFTQGSTGMTEEQRAEVAERLSTSHVESQYVLSDNRGIAYQMVKPELVFEINVHELVACGNDDKIRMNPLLTFDETKGWLMEGNTPGVSALSVTVVRERSDKKPNAVDVRVSQLSDLTPFEEPEHQDVTLERSTLLERKVFKKVSGAKVMLHKFLLWKTNKEQTGQFPAYIIYHTDFSSGRKEMIKRDMLYTYDENQARELFESELAANVTALSFKLTVAIKLPLPDSR